MIPNLLDYYGPISLPGNPERELSEMIFVLIVLLFMWSMTLFAYLDMRLLFHVFTIRRRDWIERRIWTRECLERRCTSFEEVRVILLFFRV